MLMFELEGIVAQLFCFGGKILLMACSFLLFHTAIFVPRSRKLIE